jgi:putative transposase
VDHVEWATLTYVDWFNNRRIHNEIGKIPPAELEENYYRQIAAPELVTSQTNESA